MSMVATVCAAVQRVLTVEAEALGAECGLIQRRRKFTAASLAQTLIFGLLQHPKGSWESLAELAAIRGVSVSPQAIKRRCNKRLVQFLERLCETLMQRVIAAPPALVELLNRFSGVYLLDSTTLKLPDAYAAQWPGCGGNGSLARLKLQVCWDLVSGALTALKLEPGRDPDQKSSLQREGLPPGALRIADLGYFCLKTLRELAARGAYFISRMQCGTGVFHLSGEPLDLLAWLRVHATEPAELEVHLGGEARLRCRLLAFPASQAIVDKRRRRLREESRRKGRTPSQERLEWCAWTIYVTNVERERLVANEVVVLYRARWQIELLFKLWKSHGYLDAPVSGDAECRMTILLARLLAVIVQHWFLLTSVWHLPDRSLTKAARAIRAFARGFATALDDAAAFAHQLEALARSAQRTARLNQRKHNPNTHQLLQNPSLLEYT